MFINLSSTITSVMPRNLVIPTRHTFHYSSTFTQLNLQVDGSDIDEPAKVPEAFDNNFPSFCNNICL
jgi:hypothetical protein